MDNWIIHRIMKIAYIKCAVWPSTAGVGRRHTRFMEPRKFHFYVII